MMSSTTLRTLQDPILPLPWVCFRRGGFSSSNRDPCVLNQNPRVGDGLAAWTAQDNSLRDASLVLWCVTLPSTPEPPRPLSPLSQLRAPSPTLTAQRLLIAF
jgi:hypothetical protein